MNGLLARRRRLLGLGAALGAALVGRAEAQGAWPQAGGRRHLCALASQDTSSVAAGRPKWRILARTRAPCLGLALAISGVLWCAILAVLGVAP